MVIGEYLEMLLSLADAAKLAGISKSTLFKALKRGAVSGVRDPVTSQWRVQISELERVYPLQSPVNDAAELPENSHSTARIVPADFIAERQHYERLIASLESERDYLRQALQTEQGERQRLMLLLTPPHPSTESAAPRQRVPWPLYLIAASTFVVACIAVWHGFSA